MANGRPGDHPYTDIVIHGYTKFSSKVTEIVEAVDDKGPHSAKQEVRTLLWITPRNPSDEEVKRLEEALEKIQQHVTDGENYDYESPLEACLAEEEAVYDPALRELIRDTHEVVSEAADDRGWIGPTLNTYLWVAGWETDNPERMRTDLESLQEDPLKSSLEFVLWE